MTCYLRHMGWMFRTLEIDKDAGNKHRMDRAIKRALHLPANAPCDEVQAHLDGLSAEERFALIDDVGRELRD